MQYNTELYPDDRIFLYQVRHSVCFLNFLNILALHLRFGIEIKGASQFRGKSELNPHRVIATLLFLTGDSDEEDTKKRRGKGRTRVPVSRGTCHDASDVLSSITHSYTRVLIQRDLLLYQHSRAPVRSAEEGTIHWSEHCTVHSSVN